MKKVMFVIAAAMMFAACGGNAGSSVSTNDSTAVAVDTVTAVPDTTTVNSGTGASTDSVGNVK